MVGRACNKVDLVNIIISILKDDSLLNNFIEIRNNRLVEILNTNKFSLATNYILQITNNRFDRASFYFENIVI